MSAKLYPQVYNRHPDGQSSVLNSDYVSDDATVRRLSHIIAVKCCCDSVCCEYNVQPRRQKPVPCGCGVLVRDRRGPCRAARVVAHPAVAPIGEGPRPSEQAAATAGSAARAAGMTVAPPWPNRCVAAAVLLLMAATLCGGEPPPPPPLPLTSRTVRTKYGDVSGVIVSLDSRHLEPVEVFRGVPYASPPVGSLRFMPPVTGALWSGVKMADKFGPVCPQRLPDIANETAALRRMPRGRLEHLRRLLPYLSEQSEDCLYLNIYAPVQGAYYDLVHIHLPKCLHFSSTLTAQLLYAFNIVPSNITL